jgi:hypothetical protein
VLSTKKKGDEMKTALAGAVALVGLLSAGCAGLTHPQNAEEFRAKVPAMWTEKTVVKRPFRTVADVLKKKSSECLDVTVTREFTEYNGPYSSRRTRTVKYRPTVEVSSKRAALQLQLDDGARGGMQNVPQGGMYIMVFDAYPVSNDTTRLEIYGGSMSFKVIPDAIKSWINGTSMGCPDLSKISA